MAKVWFNGEIVEESKARVPVTDRCFLLGDGVFETMRAYDGVIFHREGHLERLAAGLRQTRIRLPWNGEDLTTGIDATLAANAMTDARVRLTVSRGVPLDGPANPADLTREFRPNVLITTAPISTRGGHGQSSWRLKTFAMPLGGSAFPDTKFCSYGPHVLARAMANENGADEALILNAKGRACEGAMSNLFWVCDGVLMTPPLKEGCLDGVTRRTVWELAKANGFSCAKKRGRMHRLFSADEVFMTASTLEIMPVRSINGNLIGMEDEAFPGPATLKLKELYAKAVDKYVAEHKSATASR